VLGVTLWGIEHSLGKGEAESSNLSGSTILPLHICEFGCTTVGMSLNIQAIDHVQITVPPSLEDAAITFYEQTLGLARVAKPEPLASRGGAWFDVGGVQLHVSLEDSAGEAVSKRHVCLMVDDLEAAQQELLRAGCDIAPEDTQPDGLRRFFTVDPAGNRLEIASRG
jgi:catechol 2,3-dioxygenase-like lactoylglutathione lyase family enzyme